MRYFAIIIFVLFSFFSANMVLAVGVNDTVLQTNVTLINPLKGIDCSGGNGDCLMALLNSILDFVIQIGSVLIILVLVYIGYLFVYYSRTPGKIAEARKALLWTVIGALILLGAKAISLGIQETVKALSGS